MKIAVIYTGEIRTFEKTINFFQRNVLRGDSNVHVFATLQSNEKDRYGKMLFEKIGENLKSLEWLEKDDAKWLSIKHRQLEKMNIWQELKLYLSNGGSLIEYYQLKLSYQKLVEYEKNNNITYDYIVRCRTDTIFNKPIDFSWLSLSDKDIEERMSKIPVTNVTEKLVYFMATIVSGDLLNNFSDLVEIYSDSPFPQESYYLSMYDKYLRNYLANTSNHNLREYINKGRYIIAIRKNLLYIVKREFFNNIPDLGERYGEYNFFKNEYWWNAESQFRSACAESFLSIFNYDTHSEEKSISNYREEDFFKNGEIINKNSLYCLVRF